LVEKAKDIFKFSKKLKQGRLRFWSKTVSPIRDGAHGVLSHNFFVKRRAVFESVKNKMKVPVCVLNLILSISCYVFSFKINVYCS